MRIGANYLKNDQCEFVVWAPFVKSISLKLILQSEKLIPMQKDESGYWRIVVDDVKPGDLYFYRLDGGRDRPDPASYYQPYGVHKASQIIDHNVFKWQDKEWKGMHMSEMIMYELHVGTFTSEGTFDTVIPKLDDLKNVGINTIEIMPVAQFPGERNWGYDGVYPFAVQNSYGGQDGLKRLVNECHKKRIAVILDVVYNHLGPEGNYLWDYGHYFTDKYKTPWGLAINFDGPYSNEVRNYFIENALYWFKNYHIDALRLDAIHGICDMSARPFLLELAEKVEEFSQQKGRKYYLIAESDLNNSLVARSRDKGGFGIDCLWNDDFHHAIHTLITDEANGYYIDFGRIGHLMKSLEEGYVYSGQYSEFRKRSHGNSSKDMPADKFIVFSQNHDQIGNRMKGERMSSLVSFESLKLAAGIVLLSPYIPLLFMGEEYRETAPFLYFVSHSDPQLIEGIRQGRKKDYDAFNWRGEPPDPQDLETFIKSKIDWKKRNQANHKVLLNLYKELIHLRRDIPALANLDNSCLKVWGHKEKKVVFMRRWKDSNHILALFNFNKIDENINLSHKSPHPPFTKGWNLGTSVRLDSENRPRWVVPRGQGGIIGGQREFLYGMKWKKVLDSSEEKWDGPGTLLPERIKQEEVIMRAKSFALYISEVTR